MKLKHFQLYRYRLPFQRALQLKTRTHTHRTGCVVELYSDDGLAGWGEIAPLPGFSLESLNDAIQQADHFLSRQRRVTLPPKVDALFEWIPADLFPAVAFGISGAILNIMAQAAGLGHLHQLFRERESLSVPVNGLLTANEKLSDVIDRLNFHGFEVLKIKVGAPDVDSDIQLIQAIHKIDPDLKMRLDANRQWDLNEAIYFGNALKALNLEYIEEPVNDPADIPVFIEKTGLPVALDETLLQAGWQKRFPEAKALAAAYIIKPTFIGHLKMIRSLVAEARDTGKIVIFTGAFESGIGTGTIAELGSIWGSDSVSMGLNTYRRLGKDVLTRRLVQAGHYLELPELPWSLNRDMLELINVE